MSSGTLVRLFAAARSLVYMTGFLALWAWLALATRSVGAHWALALSPATHRPGGALMGAGALLCLSCVAMFVTAGRGTPAPFDPPRAFVPGGPYRWVRNPMYLGALVMLTGFGLWDSSLAMVLFTVPAAFVADRFVVWYEEPALTRRFGPDYTAYLATVNRWLPRPPRRDGRAG